MDRIFSERTLLGALALAAAGVAPPLFPLAQAGYAKLSTLGAFVLPISAASLAALVALAAWRGHRRLRRRILAGAAAGFLATCGLELVRQVSFRLGGMPGDMPRLLGVLLTDRFMLGPSPASDLAGYAYHFYNGIAFGIIFAVLLGRKPVGWALVYAQLIGLGFLVSPAVEAMGIGFMGSGMPAMPLTVVLAHLAFGLLLGLLTRRWLTDSGWLLAAPEPAAETGGLSAGAR